MLLGEPGLSGLRGIVLRDPTLKPLEILGDGWHLMVGGRVPKILFVGRYQSLVHTRGVKVSRNPLIEHSANYQSGHARLEAAVDDIRGGRSRVGLLKPPRLERQRGLTRIHSEFDV